MSSSTRPRECGRCRHFVDDPRVIERELPGLIALSSAYGDTRGTQGFCLVHDLLLTERHRCPRFAPRRPGDAAA